MTYAFSTPGNARSTRLEPDLFTRAESRFKDWLRAGRNSDGSRERADAAGPLNDPALYENENWVRDRNLFNDQARYEKILAGS